jgi:hypothetical protein
MLRRLIEQRASSDKEAAALFERKKENILSGDIESKADQRTGQPGQMIREILHELLWNETRPNSKNKKEEE